ncbi:MULTISPECIES: hypothetical protein [unclassified Coleofasciculus]|uniref:hypothetical protein n=1 Tax=unclassified Coleofasciculus TaxID=2692782 RepID=UPI00187E2E70|nr:MULTISPECIES: hypothetical protein [unclassified Coleofasciculus]MBE9128816.1 hypothetical protein [Coleofasciculus sp. LEGE 07081]MBE9149451.1 hypothetical protein [Coleofasciculus sp. LEGE 07092]
MNSQAIKVSVALAATFASLVGFTSVARAGEGGVAGAAAFTVTGEGAVSGVAVSAAVGKENAAAAAFNYDGTNDNGLQNSAFAIGTAGVISLTGLGDPAGFTLDAVEDNERAQEQANTFSAGYSIQIGTVSEDTLVTSPAPAP